jgi:hypothetical protein
MAVSSTGIPPYLSVVQRYIAQLPRAKDSALAANLAGSQPVTQLPLAASSVESGGKTIETATSQQNTVVGARSAAQVLIGGVQDVTGNLSIDELSALITRAEVRSTSVLYTAGGAKVGTTPIGAAAMASDGATTQAATATWTGGATTQTATATWTGGATTQTAALPVVRAATQSGAETQVATNATAAGGVGTTSTATSAVSPVAADPADANGDGVVTTAEERLYEMTHPNASAMQSRTAWVLAG